MGLDPPAVVHHVLDGVGDLELPAAGGRDRLGSVVDRRREHVHADEGEVRVRLERLLDQLYHPPVIQLRDAVVLRIGDLGEKDQRVGLR